ncbi:DUF2891 domain-containing protein [Telluribacter sp.]|jgi:hypothetical protein|uniref:DUF2891 domain-containing protein n=1 Tax=Telluribacter sp. TaxID=1978767 RepID=UPI002E1646A4|nr:DUF2891 domain-containing protein [Telluribacter sp.]
MNLKKYPFVLLLLMISFAGFSQNSSLFSKEMASRLASLPIHCIDQEFPNKTGHSSDSPDDHRLLPSELHPSFYGCLDWHSSVHGHWMLAKLLKTYPDLPEREQIIAIFNRNFDPARIKVEAEYFTKYKTTRTFERTYGWAWLLKLDQELATWDTPLARQWHQNLQPLTLALVELWTNFLPKQTYPNRTGVHPNTAFGLVFALDWARTVGNPAFEKAVIEKSKVFYEKNESTPAYLEPDGSDFLSPSLEIADLMRRVLPAKDFEKWLNTFYEKRSIDTIIRMPIVSDRTDFQIVHLDGLSLSRAWCMKGIAKTLPASHPWKKLFNDTAGQFLLKTLPNVTSGNYGGDHWLASFAVYAIFD